MALLISLVAVGGGQLVWDFLGQTAEREKGIEMRESMMEGQVD